MTIPDRYPLPNIADFMSRISCSTVFSTLHLQKGYYQVPVASEDVQKTAIITHFGMFEFLHMLFGLRNAGNTFLSMMDLVLGELPFCFVYVDNILIPNLQQGSLLPCGQPPRGFPSLQKAQPHDWPPQVKICRFQD